MNRSVMLQVAFALVASGCRGQEGTGPAAPASSSRPTSRPSPPTATSTGGEPVVPRPAAVPTGSGPPAVSAKVWGFDADKVDAAPSGFSFGRTGSGKEGRWVVQAAADAPSKGNVLVQLDADPTDNRFPVAVVLGSTFKDVRLSVSCRSLSGTVDQACGLVWRFKDANNYYVTRANALEDNVRLYYVKDARRIQLGSWSGKVATKTWHRLAVEARGDRFEVTFDDQKIIDARDATFGDSGSVGVWTKADSVTQFDDLAASAP